MPEDHHRLFRLPRFLRFRVPHRSSVHGAAAGTEDAKLPRSARRNTQFFRDFSSAGAPLPGWIPLYKICAEHHTNCTGCFLPPASIKRPVSVRISIFPSPPGIVRRPPTVTLTAAFTYRDNIVRTAGDAHDSTRSFIPLRPNGRCSPGRHLLPDRSLAQAVSVSTTAPPSARLALVLPRGCPGS